MPRPFWEAVQALMILKWSQPKRRKKSSKNTKQIVHVWGTTFYSIFCSERKILFSTLLSLDVTFVCVGAVNLLYALFVRFFLSLFLCNPLEMTWSSATEMELQKRDHWHLRVCWCARREIRLFGCVLWVLSSSHIIQKILSFSHCLIRILLFLPQSGCYHILFSVGIHVKRAFLYSRTQFELIVLLFLLLVSFQFSLLFCFVLFSDFKYEIVRCTVNLVEKKNTIIVL